MWQRQTVVGHFFELDRLVVEGGISVCCLFLGRIVADYRLTLMQGKQKGNKGGIVRQKDQGYVNAPPLAFSLRSYM